MTGPEFAFEVRPQVLAAYAESLRPRAADLASAGEAVAEVRVERDWFGKLPQAGFLADRYAAHQRGVLAEAGGLAAWVAAAPAGGGGDRGAGGVRGAVFGGRSGGGRGRGGGGGGAGGGDRDTGAGCGSGKRC